MACTKVTLSIAVGDYDHVRDLTNGRVHVEGVDLVPLQLGVEDIFPRFLAHREWDVSEMSFGVYTSLVSQGDRSMVAIPVFPSRVFRHGAFYVRADKSVETPGDLAGRRVGLPEWAQTASVWAKGLLTEELGVPLRAVRWVQAGVNEAGRTEKVALALPEGLSLEPVADRSLDEMLLEGDIDAIISARPPKSFQDGSGHIVRLFSDPVRVERDYLARTGIFPIMHIVVVRAAVLEHHPWIACNLVTAFCEARDRSVARLSDEMLSTVPLPWPAAAMREAAALLGEDVWPYGLEGNRTTLETFLRLAHEQGVAHRLLRPEELFAAETLSTHAV